jgi:hypothetical protein
MNIIDIIKKLWNDHPKKKWLVIGIAVGWIIAKHVI